MTTHVTKLGRSLSGATDSYNQFIGSLERNVLTSARRFADLEVVTDQTKALPEVHGIEESIRPITKAELLMAESGGVVAIDGKVVDGTSATDGENRAAG
jgi:DNA recombination protein RmuC